MKAREPSNTTSQAVLSTCEDMRIKDVHYLIHCCNSCHSDSLRYYLGQIGLNRDGQTIRQREVDRGRELTSAQL